jgi:excisionase family DNA binding protein
MSGTQTSGRVHQELPDFAQLRMADLQGRATLGVDEAARILGIGRHTAYVAARSGQIPVIRLGRRLLVPVPALLSLLGVGEAARPGSVTAEGG